ncbi:hypothetical protein Tco_0873953 [Tanacetum coccineum]|uniref:Uncharacterized protein n=1 Tax=Tanacetum coccineum TaxID=301880 RepID=A0ABQ5BN39_9ASTR
MAKIQEVLPKESSSTGQPLEQKHDELVKKSLLTKSQFEGQLKEKSKVISDLKVKFCPNGEETVALEKESRSKLNKYTVKPYDYTYQNSLYEIFKPPSKTYLDQWNAAKEVGRNNYALVSKYLNDMNARTKKPKVVPISASKPKRKMNKSVATPYKKIVASDTTIQKPKSYFKELYENTNKAWKWWIEKKCPSEYKWTQDDKPSRPVLNGN